MESHPTDMPVLAGVALVMLAAASSAQAQNASTGSSVRSAPVVETSLVNRLGTARSRGPAVTIEPQLLEQRSRETQASLERMRARVRAGTLQEKDKPLR